MKLLKLFVVASVVWFTGVASTFAGETDTASIKITVGNISCISLNGGTWNKTITPNDLEKGYVESKLR